MLRAGAHLAANKYGQPILGLIFLRYADILFKQHKEEIDREFNKLKNSRMAKAPYGRRFADGGYERLHVGITTNNRTKVNDKCKIIAITPSENVKRSLAGSLPKWYNTDA